MLPCCCLAFLVGSRMCMCDEERMQTWHTARASESVYVYRHADGC